MSCNERSERERGIKMKTGKDKNAHLSMRLMAPLPSNSNISYVPKFRESTSATKSSGICRGDEGVIQYWYQSQVGRISLGISLKSSGHRSITNQYMQSSQIKKSSGHTSIDVHNFLLSESTQSTSHDSILKDSWEQDVFIHACTHAYA